MTDDEQRQVNHLQRHARREAARRTLEDAARVADQIAESARVQAESLAEGSYESAYAFGRIHAAWDVAVAIRATPLPGALGSLLATVGPNTELTVGEGFRYDTRAALERANALQDNVGESAEIHAAHAELWDALKRPEDRREGECFPLWPITVHLNGDGSIYVHRLDNPAAAEWCRRHNKTIVVALQDGAADTPTVVEAPP